MFNDNRPDIANLNQLGLYFDHTYEVIEHFEGLVADHFGAQYAVATDCCTHAMELVLRASNIKMPLVVPRHTYLSVPMMLDKLAIPYSLEWQEWHDSYELVPGLLRDAATVWSRGAHRRGEITCISFQFKKWICIGRGGMILLDDADLAAKLRRMCRDGRDPRVDQWQDCVQDLGYHYNITPEDAARGIMLYHHRGQTQYQAWAWHQYRDLLEFPYFRNRHAEPK